MHHFITIIRRRLNTGIALRAVLLSLIIAAVITILLGLTYIFRGFAVDAFLVYTIGLSIALTVSLIVWFTQRKNKIQSAIYADQHFDLKDSLTSALEFERAKKEGDAYKLQKEQTISSIKNLSPDSIPLPLSKKLCYGAALTLLAATSLAFIPPSEAVLKEIEEKKLNHQRTSEIKKLISEDVEKLIKSLSDDEKELIDPDAIRQWVKELKATDQKRQAMRHIARLEQKIQKKRDSLFNRKNEALLKAAGLKMQKATNIDAKALGKQLKKKQFAKAAQKLGDFKFGKKTDNAKTDDKKSKLTKADKKRKLTEKQKQLAKLRSITKSLSQSKPQGSSGQQGKSLSLQQFAKALENAGHQLDLENLKLQDLKELPQELLNQIPPELLKKLNPDQLRQLPPELLEKLLELMQQDADNLQEMMDGMELDQMQGEELTDEEWEELLKQLKNMDQNLESLQQMLKRLEAMKRMRMKLGSLSQRLGLAQGFLNGNKSLSQFRMKGKGGKKPGFGTDTTRRKEKDKLENNNQYSKIRGLKGSGPVKSSIEEADSGTGTSRRRGEAKKRTFQHQMSSFIEREDVSEEMKQGVKQYFEDIHKTSK